MEHKHRPLPLSYGTCMSSRIESYPYALLDCTIRGNEQEEEMQQGIDLSKKVVVSVNFRARRRRLIREGRCWKCGKSLGIRFLACEDCVNNSAK